MDEVEVALHHAVFTWLSVDGDISIIKVNMLAVFYKREVVLVNLNSLTIIQGHVPISALHIDEIDIITLLVEERIQTLT